MKPKRILPLTLLHTFTTSLVKGVFVFAAMRRFARLFVALILLALPLFFLTRVGTHVPTAYAATSDNLNFQARLQTSAGAIVPDGFYNVEFKLYDDPSAGTLLWTETRYDSNGVTAGNDNRVRVVNGYLTVNLGDITAFPGSMPWDQQMYLTMNIGGSTQTATPTYDGEMSPRLKLTAVPYAFNAKTASELVKTNGALTGSLSIQSPTIGNQIFQIRDQAVAGTYNLLTENEANAGFIQLQGSTPGTAQTGNFNISGTGIASVLQASSSITTVDLTSTGQSILGGDDDQIQVIVTADASQTANILEFQSSAGVTLSSFDTSGQLTLGRIAASGATQAGNLTFADGTTSNFGASIETETLTADRRFLLPNTTLATTASPATICVYNGATSNCPAATGSAYYIQNQNAGAQSSATFWIDGVARADGGLTGPSFDTATAGALSIGTTNATSINLNQSTVLAAGESITITGGNTASRPGSPTEGMVYFDSDTDRLLTYSNGKWQADRTDAVLVAASNSSQSDKDAADYVADGNTGAALDGDQVQINAALTAASGKKVVLLAGTYTVDASVSVPNNTILTGVGNGTLLTIPNGFDASINVIINTDITTGAGVTIRDLKLDGNKANQTSGAMQGIYMNKMGDDSGGSARTGATITGVYATSFTSNAIDLYQTGYNTLTGNTAKDNDASGFSLVSTRHSSLSGNVAATNGSDGFSVSSSTINTLAGNTALDNVGDGFYIYASGNNLNSNTAKGNDNGFNLFGGNNNILTDNKSESSDQYGMDLSNVWDSKLSNNKIYDGLYIDTSDSNTVEGNTITQGIYIVNSDSNIVIGNIITSGTDDNYAIDIADIDSDDTYLADNYFTSNGDNLVINDAGTGTVYAGQSMDENGQNIRFKQPNSTAAVNIQNADGVNVLNVDTADGELELGNYNGGVDAVEGKIVFANTTNSNTVTLTSAAQTTDSYILSIPDLTGDDTICTVGTGCGTGYANTALSNLASVAINTSLISDTTNTDDLGSSAITWRTGYFGTSVIAPLLDTNSAVALNIGTTNATVINLNQDVTIAANQNVTFAAGTGNFDQSASSGTFSTSTGAVSLNGDTTVATGKNLTVTSGTTSLTGTTNINTTGSGTTTIGSVAGGAVSITANAASNFTTNTGALTLTSAAATTWSTTAGALTLQGAAGATIRTADGATSSAVTITTGNASAGASGNISVDTGTATTTAGTISIGTANASGVTIGRATVTTTIQGSLSISPQASTSTTLLCTNAGVVSTCDAAVLAPTATNFIQNQNAGAQATSNYWISGTGRADTSMLTPLLDTATATALNIGTTNATSINLNQSTVLATGKTIRFTGDTYANISGYGSPTEGMTTYDTTNKQLLVYANGKWQADKTDAILVAANNSSQADKNAADYVGNGNTVAANDGDQVQINAALTAAAGKKVVLLAGTYVVDATILVPNNTTLSGVGDGSVIEWGVNSTDNMIENSDIATGTGVSIRDVKLDGRDDLYPANVNGIYFNGMGAGSGASARKGGNIIGVYAFRISNIAVALNASSNNTIVGNIVKDSFTGFSSLTSSNNTFSGNTAQYMADAGFNMFSSLDNTLTGNTSQGNGSGFKLTSSSGNTLTGNTINANTGHGVILTTSTNNMVTGNNISDSGGATANNGIYFSGADTNTVSNNTITDTSCSTTCYAVNIFNSTSDNNYLAGNVFSTTSGTATINDAGTGTRFAGQSMTAGGLDIRFKQPNSANAFNVQNGTGTAVLNVDTSTNTVQVAGAFTSTGGAVNINASSNFAVNIATGTSTGAVSIGNSANTTTLGSNTINLGTTGANTTLQGATQGTLNTAGNGLTVQGSTGNGTGAGGTLTIRGGTGGASNANGGNIVITGGAATGSGTQGLVTFSTSAFTSATTQSFGVTGNLTAGLVDQYSTIPVSATATGVTVTIPAPAAINQVVGRILYLANVGANDFNILLTGTSINISLKPNSTATLIWNGTGWTAAGASSSTDLQSAYNNTLTSAGGAELVLNPAGGAADGLTIRNNGTAPITGGILEVQSSIGTNLFSVNNAGLELAANGGAETSASFGTDWTAAPVSAAIARTTTAGEFKTGLAATRVTTTSTAFSGVRNNLSGNPVVSTTYTVSFTAKSSINGTPIDVLYTRNGGTNTVACTDYGTGVAYATLSNTVWTKVTCTITTDATGASNPDLFIRKTDGSAPIVYIDNLSFIRNDSSTQPSNVQIGGGISGGQVTLFTLDRSSSPPVANGDSTYFGSMYYDTTSGRIQCYESDGWGACGSAPDNIVVLTPEYSNAVLNGTGVGTMTADFCANQGGVLTVGSLCASGIARNFYKWTSPQPTPQTYSVYVSYKLPSTFKNFYDSGTIKLTGYRDHGSNANLQLSAFRSTGSAISQCGSTTQITTGTSTWDTVSLSGTDETTCGFQAGEYVIFRIDVTSQSNANVYVENLEFRYTNT